MLFFSFYLLLPMLPLYLNDTFSASKQIIGFVLSGYTVTALIIRPFGGFVIDSFPRKKILLICYFTFFIFFAGYLVAGTLLIFAVIRTLHGLSFGSVTVANSTVAIDVMPPSRRAEGIGFYGISNNLAMAIGPTIALYMYEALPDFHYIFALSLITSGIGFAFVSTVKPRKREMKCRNQPLSLDRFFLTKGIPEGITLIFFSFAYGILSTYLAIYGKDEIGITSGSGLFFMLMALGLILSRLFSSHSLNKGYITQNITVGMVLAIVGFTLFVAIRIPLFYYISAVIIGGGYGCLCPSYQTIFINLAPNSQRGTANSTYLTSWDIGVGAGVLIGGYVAEHFSYHGAYCMSVGFCIIGLLLFIFHTGKHFNRQKLR
ncbi:MAG: MFS transporter, partial [Muribaculaceae bacterium]